MDIEAISGPRVNSVISPMITEELQPVGETGAFVVFSFDVKDRITISSEARKRYEEWRKNRQGQKEKK
ncbi:MAG: hypothetical protein C4526_12575 [Nitrospiraceae bacterium]|nr:MAG: hypothetical protein C4526_12575 [Nitrospiraceae bacterium]